MRSWDQIFFVTWNKKYKMINDIFAISSIFPVKLWSVFWNTRRRRVARPRPLFVSGCILDVSPVAAFGGCDGPAPRASHPLYKGSHLLCIREMRFLHIFHRIFLSEFIKCQMCIFSELFSNPNLNQTQISKVAIKYFWEWRNCKSCIFGTCYGNTYFFKFFLK